MLSNKIINNAANKTGKKQKNTIIKKGTFNVPLQ